MDATRNVTWEDYARAERYLPWNAANLVFQCSVEPNWIKVNGDKTDKFWYLRKTSKGKEFILVDPTHNSQEPLFDHVKLAASLSKAAGEYYTHNKLPFESIELSDDQQSVEFWVEETKWVCNLETLECTEVEEAEKPAKDELVSPDEKWAAFTKDYNLYVKDKETGEEYQLTDDGEKYYDYASRPEGVTVRIIDHKMAPVGIWSEDSKKLVTHRLDQRELEDMHLIQYVPEEGFRPKHYAYRYSLVGDENMPEAALLVVDVEEKTVTELKTEPLMNVGSSFADHKEAWWDENNSKLYFIRHERGHHAFELCEADAETGETRTLIREEGPTYVETTPDRYAQEPVAKVLGHGEEVLWWSERDGWGHLYLYDGKSGELKHQVTSGPWQVRSVLHVDEEERWVYFIASGREEGREPYLRHMYRIKLDGTGLELLTPEDADHGITASPTGNYYVDTYSTINTEPVSVLRAANGEPIMKLEVADLEELRKTGWKKPEPFSVKARDGITDIYGAIVYPSNFDPSRKYPVIDSIYPGPQCIRTPKFFPAPEPFGDFRVFWDAQALSELGFIVITIDGMGTPYRSKAFHDQAYGKNFAEAGGLEDHVKGIKQLATTHPYMDIERVGIFGHSGGGFASARAILQYPDFYKVAVSNSGNHDQRSYRADWGEYYMGELEDEKYDPQGNPQLAKNLKGKLLLVYGDMDDNVHPCMVIQLVDALIDANKDFDLLVLPNRNHAVWHEPYFIRRRWDYFVQHLMGATYPHQYEIEAPPTWYVPERSLKEHMKKTES